VIVMTLLGRWWDGAWDRIGSCPLIDRLTDRSIDRLAVHTR
jgi:hypothetical protein